MRLKSNFGFMKSEHIGLRALATFWTFHGTAEVYRYMLLSGKVVVHHICAYDIIHVCEHMPHSSPDMCPQPESCLLCISVCLEVPEWHKTMAFTD